MTEKVDVVIPTRGEWSLPYCVRAIRKNVQVNRLILVAPSIVVSQIENYGNIIIGFDEKNVGKARAVGLKEVETSVYASVDSDVLVTDKWARWCLNAIEPDNVAAVQGYAKDLGKSYPELQEKWIREKGGKYGKGFCCLGNTVLKTNIVREVGMPLVRVEEDWQLRLNIEKAGYKWISNINIVCPHLKNDVDVWKHAVWWGRMGGDVPLKRCVARVPYYMTFGLKERPLTQNLFLVGLQAHLIYGKLYGRLK